MTADGAAALLWGLALLVVILLLVPRRGGRRRGGVGTAASGAMYDLLSEDKRNAIELIVEERAEARDQEHIDGNLPDLGGVDTTKR